MARKTTTYATAPYGMADESFCRFISEIQSWDMRRDVKANAVVLAVAALTRCWPASHFNKKERDRWARKATAAFQVAESELAKVAGMGEWRTHTAITKMLDAGFVVELAPARPRGEGRGNAPRTLALRCHVEGKVDSSNIDSVSVLEDSRADQSRPAQTWRL